MAAPPPAAVVGAAVAEHGLSTAGKIFFGSLTAGTFALGVWQTCRFQEKLVLTADRRSDLQQPPVTTAWRDALLSFRKQQQQEAAAAAKQQHQRSFRRVLLKGRFRHEQEMLVGPRGAPAGAFPESTAGGGGMQSSPQGYYVVTPLEIVSENEETDDATDDDDDGKTRGSIVLVNRGWVPRNMVVSDHYRSRSRSPSPAGGGERERGRGARAGGQGGGGAPTQQRFRQQQQQEQVQQQRLLQWDRPETLVQLTVVPVQREVPRFLIAQHDWSTLPPKLYWFDLPTMMKFFHDTTTTTNKKGTGGGNMTAKKEEEKDDDDDVLLPVLVTAVTAAPPSSESEHKQKQQKQKQQKQQEESSWPVAVSADKVGEFKTTPAIHAGYAATWYGLTCAGLYMTRLLVTKGKRP